MKRRIPNPLWVSITFLALMTIAKLGFVASAPLILIDIALSALLLFGLITGKRWAYILAIGFTVLGTVATLLTRGTQMGLAVLAFDGIVLIPVLLCTSYFFPETTERT